MSDCNRQKAPSIRVVLPTESEDNMRKIIVFVLVVALIAAMSVTAFAVTPKWEYKPVKLPQIKVSIKIPDKVFTDWFADHPIRFTAPVLG
jgi:hypothetical protein